jgi:hypothetical protein
MNGRLERLGPLTGIVAVALFVLGVFLFENVAGPPGDDASPQEYLAYYQDESSAILWAGVTFQLGAVFFLWFLGSLRARLAAAEGPLARLTATAFAGGIVASACALLLPGADMAGALSEDQLTPDAAVVFNNLGDAFFLGAEFAAAVLVAAAGLVILATRVLPRWLGWVSLALALVLLIGPIGWAGLIFGMPLWTLAVSLFLYLRPAVVEPAPAATAVP